MTEETERKSGAALWLAAVAVLAAGGIGAWFFLSDRSASTVDDGGFDVSATSRPRTPATAASPAVAPAAPPSSLGMVKGGAEALNAAEGTAKPSPDAPQAPAAAPAPSAAAPLTREQALKNFVAQARKHEGEVARYAAEWTAKSPVIRQYGKDWMSCPDLKKLNDDYFRDHDPVAFAIGLAKAPNFRVILAKYAGAPDVQAAVVTGLTKAAPAELVQSGLDAARLDPRLGDLAGGVARKLGLPPGMTAVLTSAEPTAADKAKAAGELKASPAGGR